MTEREILEQAASGRPFTARDYPAGLDALHARLEDMEDAGLLWIRRAHQTDRSRDTPIDSIRVELALAGMERLEELCRG
jgi:hypothetical protein